MTNISEELARRIYDRLQAIVDQMSTSAITSENIGEIQVQEQTETNSQTDKVKIDVSYSGAGAGAERADVREVKKTDRNTLETKYGFTFTEDQTDHVLEPSTVWVQRVADLWRQQLVNSVERIVIATGSFADFKHDAPVPASFVATSVTVADPNQGPTYPSVPVGSALCYFGLDIPPGYVLADGGTSWAQREWVPAHLRGQPVPKMNARGILIGGTDDQNAIGIPTDPGSLTVRVSDVPGSAFSVPITRLNRDRSSPPVLRFGHVPSTPVMNPLAFGNPGTLEDVRQSVERFNIRIIDTFPTGTVTGRHRIEDQILHIGTQAAPPHVPCRWIIRMN